MMVFRSKVDLWLALVLIGTLAAVMYGGFVVWRDTHILLPLLIPASTVALVLLLGVPTQYAFDDDELIVRSGIIRYRIPYRTITSVQPSYEAWSSPAWSLDRLKVCADWSPAQILISPSRREEFMQELQRRTGLQRDGLGLER